MAHSPKRLKKSRKLPSAPKPVLPPSFTRREMAARTRWLYPRVLSPRTAGEGLWLITNNFSTGGAQSSARRLLIGLAQRGVKVRAAVVEEHPSHPTPGRTALMRAGIPVLAVPLPGALDAPAAVARVLAAIDADRPRAVLFWNLIPVFKVLFADALLDVPVFDVSPGEMYFTSLEKYFANPCAGLPYLSRRNTERGLRASSSNTPPNRIAPRARSAHRFTLSATASRLMKARELRAAAARSSSAPPRASHRPNASAICSKLFASPRLVCLVSRCASPADRSAVLSRTRASFGLKRATCR